MYSFFNFGARCVWVVNATPRLINRYPLYRRQDGPQGPSEGVRKISPYIGIRPPDRPARSESLYRLIVSKDVMLFGWLPLLCWRCVTGLATRAVFRCVIYIYVAIRHWLIRLKSAACLTFVVQPDRLVYAVHTTFIGKQIYFVLQYIATCFGLDTEVIIRLKHYRSTLRLVSGLAWWWLRYTSRNVWLLSVKGICLPK
jgi:hypothetical protein